jgi:hypothetical protein
VKRRGKSGAKRDGRKGPRTTKAVQIVKLVQALSPSLGSSDGVYLGRGIARLLADAYAKRPGAMPRWARELIAYYSSSTKAS